jgi:hypothetical protein
MYEHLHAIREMGLPMIIMGDMNARTIEWGDTIDTVDGRMVMERMALLDMHILNTIYVPSCPTFRTGSVLDLAFVNDERLIDDMTIDDELVGEHRAIVLTYHGDAIERKTSRRIAWDVKNAKWDAFAEMAANLLQPMMTEMDDIYIDFQHDEQDRQVDSLYCRREMCGKDKTPRKCTRLVELTPYPHRATSMAVCRTS